MTYIVWLPLVATACYMALCLLAPAPKMRMLPRHAA